MVTSEPRPRRQAHTQNKAFRFVSFRFDSFSYGSTVLYLGHFISLIDLSRAQLTSKVNKQHKSQNAFWDSIEFQQKKIEKTPDNTRRFFRFFSLFGAETNSRGLQMIISSACFYVWFKILWSDGKYKIIHFNPNCYVYFCFCPSSVFFFFFWIVVVDTRDTTNTYLIRWPIVIRLHKKM